MSMPSLNIIHKFIAYLILLSIVPLLVVAVVSYQIASNILKDETSRYTTEIIHHQLDYIDLQLEQVESLITSLSGVDTIRNALELDDAILDDYDRLTTSAHIGYILSNYSNLKGLVSIDIFTVGGTRYHVGDTLNTENIRADLQERIFNETLHSDKLVTWLGVEDNINVNSAYSKVIVASKVLYTFDRDTLQQEPIALLLVNYSLEHLYEHLAHINLGKDAHIIVMDAKGRIIYHPDISLLGELANPKLVEIVSSGEGSQLAAIDGVNMSINFASSNLSDWTIIGLVPMNTLNAKSGTIQNAVFIVLAICFVGVAIVASIYTQNVVMPIREITQQLKLIQKNPSHAKQNNILVQGHDEIAELSQWFNSTQTLYHASHTLMSFGSLSSLLQNIVNDLVQAVSADRVTLITVDLETEQITRFIRGGANLDKVVQITFEELNEGLSGWVLREGKPAISPKGIPDARESKEVQQRRIETDCGDIIVIPLTYGGEIRGTITAINAPHGRSFTEQDMELMLALANQAAIALENAQLLDSLRLSEEKFVKAFQASPEPMSIISLEDRRYIEVNDSFLEMTAHQREAIINQPVLELDILFNTEAYFDFINITEKQGFVRNFEIVFEDKAGEQSTWLLSSEVIELNSKQCLLTLAKDITEQKEAEQHRIDLTLERERIRILADFITEASHEFKTPLSVINTNAYLLGKTLEHPKQEARLGQIVGQVKIINQLVDTLTAMTKLDSGEQRLALTETNLNDVLRAIYHDKETILREKNLSCVLELSETPILLKCDMNLLKQAISAIWHNAIQYTPEKGSITVSVKQCENKVVIKVMDTGIGIKEDEVAHIFERFFQSDKAGTERGFGLGLSIAQTIIELHDGKIEVESAVDEGSIFRIILPMA